MPAPGKQQEPLAAKLGLGELRTEIASDCGWELTFQLRKAQNRPGCAMRAGAVPGARTQPQGYTRERNKDSGCGWDSQEQTQKHPRDWAGSMRWQHSRVISTEVLRALFW